MRELIHCFALFGFAQLLGFAQFASAKAEIDPNGYLVYCPCMGEYRQTPLPPPSLSLSERNLF